MRSGGLTSSEERRTGSGEQDEVRMGLAVLEGAGVVSISLFEPQNVEQGISHDEVRDAVANEKRDLARSIHRFRREAMQRTCAP